VQHAASASHVTEAYNGTRCDVYILVAHLRIVVRRYSDVLVATVLSILITTKILLHTKAAAQAKPSRSQAMIDGFGPARDFTRPKPRLSGQAGPEQHYSPCCELITLESARGLVANMAFSSKPNTYWFTFLLHAPLSVSPLKACKVNPDAMFSGTTNTKRHGVLLVGRRPGV